MQGLEILLMVTVVCACVLGLAFVALYYLNKVADQSYR
jgi:hypothetical protein